MRQNKFKLKNKKNFLYLYKNQIQTLKKIFLMMFLMIFLLLIPKFFIIFIFIVFTYYLIHFIWDISCYIFNQLKIPLTQEELKKLNITNETEYAEYLYKLLHKIKPSEKVCYQLILSFYQNFSKDDSYGFKSIDINKFDIFKIDKNLKQNLHNLCEKKYSGLWIFKHQKIWFFNKKNTFNIAFSFFFTIIGFFLIRTNLITNTDSFTYIIIFCSFSILSYLVKAVILDAMFIYENEK